MRQLTRLVRGLLGGAEWVKALQQGYRFGKVADLRRARQLWQQFEPREVDQRVDGSENAFAFWLTQPERKRQIFKWQHYFEIYSRHVSKFIGRHVRVLEIGVLGGGSLEMWRDVFGPKCEVYGVDIDPNALDSECDRIVVRIGDQSDKTFWAQLWRELKWVDIVVDDGSHIAAHQIITFEECWPFIRPGGVYICEDVHGRLHAFQAYMAGLVAALNTYNVRDGIVMPTKAQANMLAVSWYPFCVVCEKRTNPLATLEARKVGEQK